MQGSGFVWRDKPSVVFPQMTDAYLRAIRAGVLAIAQRRAPEVQNWLRDNAPWTDRTGNLRQALFTDVENLAEECTLYLSHGLSYGVH